jgi:plasmid replication initiation protein
MNINTHIIKRPKELVVQSNEVTEALYKFSLHEKRGSIILFYEIRKAIAEKQQYISLEDDLKIKFNSDALLGIVSHKTTAYKSFQELVFRTMEIKTKGKRLTVSLINWVEYNTATGEIIVEVSHKILPYLAYLPKEFTQFPKILMLSLCSVYSQRFLEHCHRWNARGYFYLDIDELREMFCLEKKYKNYDDLIRNVVIPAQRELNENFLGGASDLCFSWSPDPYSQVGKKITRLNFYVINPTRLNRKFDDYLYQIRNDIYEIFGDKKMMITMDSWLIRNCFFADEVCETISQLKSACPQLKELPNAILQTLKKQFQINL